MSLLASQQIPQGDEEDGGDDEDHADKVCRVKLGPHDQDGQKDAGNWFDRGQETALDRSDNADAVQKDCIGKDGSDAYDAKEGQEVGTCQVEGIVPSLTKEGKEETSQEHTEADDRKTPIGPNQLGREQKIGCVGEGGQNPPKETRWSDRQLTGIAMGSHDIDPTDGQDNGHHL